MNKDEMTILLKKADLEFEKRYNLVTADVLRGYKKALDDIRFEISKALESASQYPTLTELRKFNRLERLEKRITEIIAEMQKPIINKISQSIKTSLVASYSDTVDAIAPTLSDYANARLTFDVLPKKSIDFVLTDNLWLDSLKNHNAKLLTDAKLALEKTLRTNAREDIASGLVQGKPYASIIKDIKERFDVTAGRAKAITFTEMHKGHSFGRNEGINKAIDSAKKLGIKAGKMWKHNNVGKPRPSHLALDGTMADSNGYFRIGSLKAGAPGLFGDPKEDIFCHCNASFQIAGIG